MKLNLAQRLQVQEFVVCIRFGFQVLESGWALSVATRSLLSGDPLKYDERNAHNHEDETQYHKCNHLKNITQSVKERTHRSVSVNLHSVWFSPGSLAEISTAPVLQGRCEGRIFLEEWKWGWEQMWHLKQKSFSSVLHLGYVHVTIKSSMWQIWLTDEAEDVTNVGDEDDEQVG